MNVGRLRLSDGRIFHSVQLANFYCSMSSTQPVSLSHKTAARGWYMGPQHDVSEKHFQ